MIFEEHLLPRCCGMVKVVFAGSFNADPFILGNDSELYDPATNAFIPIEKTFYHAQTNQSGVRLLDVTVMFPVGVNGKLATMPTTYLYVRIQTISFLPLSSISKKVCLSSTAQGWKTGPHWRYGVKKS